MRRQREEEALQGEKDEGGLKGRQIDERVRERVTGRGQHLSGPFDRGRIIQQGRVTGGQKVKREKSGILCLT